MVPRMKLKIENPVVICSQSKKHEAASRIREAIGIDPIAYPAFMSKNTRHEIAFLEILRVNAAKTKRLPGCFGAALSFIGVVQMAIAMKWDSVTIFEDDVCFADGFLEKAESIEITDDVGAVDFGPVFWCGTENLEEDEDGVIYNYTRRYPVSCKHAVHILKIAFEDILAKMVTLDMAPDDLIAMAYIESDWKTILFHPPIAHQDNRPETFTGIG